MIRLFLGLLAFACFAAAAFLATHYPVARPLAPVALVVLVGVFVAWPHFWIAALPGLLPVIGFAPWTGWLTFEEMDMVVLAAAAVGYSRFAGLGISRNSQSLHQIPFRSSNLTAVLLLALLLLTLVIAMFRGFEDAGGFMFGWFQGYHEPLNSVRLAKPLFVAALLLPIWLWSYRADAARSLSALRLGLILGLAAASLTTVWERVAFVGLLDFSSDYRTTGLFWEMHVGGAALDGFLALTVPFALREIMTAKTTARWGLAAAVLSFAAYACLTTFSRGVYLAIPVGGMTFWALHWRQSRVATTRNQVSSGFVRPTWRLWVVSILLLVGFAVCAQWVFSTSGYRGLVALTGSMALTLPLVEPLRLGGVRQVATGFAGAVTATALVFAIAFLTPKGPYVSFALSAAVTLVLLLALYNRRLKATVAAPLAFAGLLATMTSMVLVAVHWGYQAAFWPALTGAGFVLLVLLVGVAANESPWPKGIRTQAGLAFSMALIAAVVGVFGGGAYMGNRLENSSRDLDNRQSHWSLGLGMLVTDSDWWLGKGLGRYPANHFLVGDPQQHPGDYRMMQEGGNGYIKIAGGLHMNGWSEIFRVTQRVPETGSPVKVRARVRAATNVTLAFEVCEKHLLYNRNCMARQHAVKAAPGQWQRIEVNLEGSPAMRGVWYAPRILAFSVAMDTRGGVADLDDLKLIDPSGQDQLMNGDFSRGLAHWFSSSDKHHLPWHMKSMPLHVLFEQGVAGLVCWSLLFATALFRVTVGRASHHPLAPPLAAAMIGFFVVGLFDSLLDIPRVATLFYLLVLVALTISAPKSAPAAGFRSSSTHIDHPVSTDGRAISSRRTVIIKLGLAASFVLTFLVGVGGSAGLTGKSPSELTRTTPAEWIRQAKIALAPYPFIQSTLLPSLEFIQSKIERPPPDSPLPSLGKGQQASSLPAQMYLASGLPAALPTSVALGGAISTTLKVASSQELVSAIATASAGQVIEILPGSYTVSDRLTTGKAGTPAEPITLRAAKPGQVVLQFDLVQGIRVNQPHWVFENLTFRGVCANDSKCEHALHIVGSARGIVVRNNRLEDFNAHIKVNGEDGNWPDGGLLQFNRFTNSRPRQTGTPVTPIDIVGASHWQILDNVIMDFASADGGRVSYGVFMKGAGQNGRIERNVVVCTSRNISGPGVRVGISWGGGRTEPAHCRDGECLNEFTRGFASNNLVAHCNDAGIDVNGGQQIMLSHNTLVNTAGIHIRGRSNSVDVDANLLEGRIRADPHTEVRLSNNQVTALGSMFVAPDKLQFGYLHSGPVLVGSRKEVDTDFCHLARYGPTPVGANPPAAHACTLPQK